MVDFLIQHPTFTIGVIGSLIGTIIDYALHDFSVMYLSASEYFTIGTLGFASFQHRSWTHFIGNMCMFLPFSLISESIYHEPFCLILMIIFMVLSCMSSLFTKICWGGLSGVCYLFMGLACFYNYHWWAIAIFVYFMAVDIYWMFRGGDGSTNNYVHVAGGVLGMIVAIVFQLLK